MQWHVVRFLTVKCPKMLPILKQVNELVEHPESFPQLYIMLIVVLLLTQDDVFVDSIQKIVCINSHLHVRVPFD